MNHVFLYQLSVGFVWCVLFISVAITHTLFISLGHHNVTKVKRIYLLFTSIPIYQYDIFQGKRVLILYRKCYTRSDDYLRKS